MNEIHHHSQYPADELRAERSLRALAFLVATIRPDWDEPGIIAAARAALHSHSLPDVSIAAIRAAGRPEYRTPGIIPKPGEHWRWEREATPTPAKYVHPPRPERPRSPETEELLAETRRKIRHRSIAPGAELRDPDGGGQKE
jgi:hypothetical protein